MAYGRHPSKRACGDTGRALSEAESAAAGKAVAAVIKLLASYPREVTVYALAAVVTAMANDDEDPPTAEGEIIDAIHDLQKYRTS